MTSAAEEAPPAPAAEPEPEPVQEAAPGAEGVWPPAEGEGVWPPAAGDDEPPPVDEPVQAAEEEGGFDFSGVEEAPPQEEEGELPPQPKKKPKFFVHWDRRKPSSTTITSITAPTITAQWSDTSTIKMPPSRPTR